MTVKAKGAVTIALVVVASSPAAAPTGFQEQVQISAPTRIDWKFAASAFGPAAIKIPAAYDSRQQRYQLFVPRAYDSSLAWPLVIFISPGDEPLGWRSWQKTCEKAGVLFCAPYGGGNSCPVGQRTRLVLDMLDDVRRHYQIDPDQTYLTGFSGGGRMACSIAYALPEYFGGVAPVCGTNPLPRLDALRHRLHDRLSVAFVTGESDFNRKETEVYMAPLLADLGIRTKLWVVPKVGHGLPPDPVLAEVYAWLADDLKRRREDARAHPGLALAAGDALTPEKVAARHVDEAEADLKKPGRTWRGVALLRAVRERWPDTSAGDRARKLLEEIVTDETRARAILDEGGRDERELLSATARALERFGDFSGAMKAWNLLAKGQPDTPAGQKAALEAKRLRTALAASPYLGIGFAPNSVLVTEVARRGPADKAGLMPGDKLLKVGGARVASPDQVRQALGKHKPGDQLDLEIERGGKVVTLTAEVGSIPVKE